MRWALLVVLLATACASEPETQLARQLACDLAPGAAHDLDTDQPPVVAGGFIYVHHAATVFRIDASTGVEDRFLDQARVIDAYQDALLFVRDGALFYRDSEREVMLDGSDHLAPPKQGVHMVEHGRAAWMRGRQVRAFDGNQVWTVASSSIAQSPSVRGDRVAYVASDGEDAELFIATGREIRQLTDNVVDDDSPFLIGDEVVWLAQSSVFLTPLPDREIKELAGGHCELSGDGAHAIYSCAGVDGYSPSGFGVYPHIPFRTCDVYWGAIEPRIAADMAAWIECTKDGAQVVGLRLEEGARAVVLAPVRDTRCNTLSFGEPSHLAVGDGVVAWDTGWAKLP